MPNFLKKQFLRSIATILTTNPTVNETEEERGKRYEKQFPHLRKQKLEEHLKDVICDGSVLDSYYNTNIYSYLGSSKEMNWGYHGSGPQSLALNILFLFTEGDGGFARDRYLEFMEDFLQSKKQRETLKIKSHDIKMWIYKRRRPRRRAPVLQLITNGGELV